MFNEVSKFSMKNGKDIEQVVNHNGCDCLNVILRMFKRAHIVQKDSPDKWDKPVGTPLA